MPGGTNTSSDGHVHSEIRRGMDGLTQAGQLVSEQLEQFLLPHGYILCPVTPGLLMEGFDKRFDINPHHG